MVKLFICIVVSLGIFACATNSSKNNNKTSTDKYTKKVLHIVGHDSLDVALAVYVPKVNKLKHRLRLNNLDQSGFHIWKDTSWTNSQLDTCLTALLEFLHQQPHKKAQNATYLYKKEKWELEPEKPGTEIDTLALRNSLKKALASKDTLLDLRAADLYLKPVYCKDDKALEEAKKNLDKVLKMTITLSYGNTEFVLDKSKFATWLSLDKDLKVKVDYISTQNYIQDIASQIEMPLSEILALHDAEFITDSTQNQSFPRMNIFQEVEYLMSAIPLGKTIQRPIVFVPQGLPRGLKEGLTDFVEVSILDQKLWLFKGGQLVLETNVVTGNKRLNHATPTGHYHIYAKTKDRVLRGPGYASFVKYWMPFYKGYGLHDAMWRRRFGANIYENGGSHGCVNIPPKMAPLVYDNVVVGMDVIIR
jgi:hypothetical protein